MFLIGQFLCRLALRNGSIWWWKVRFKQLWRLKSTFWRNDAEKLRNLETLLLSGLITLPSPLKLCLSISLVVEVTRKKDLLAHTTLLDNIMAELCKKFNHKLLYRQIKKPKCFKDIFTSIWIISINKPCIQLQNLSFLLILFDGMTQTFCVSWGLVTEWTHYVIKSLEVISSNFFSCQNNKGKKKLF